MEIVIVFYDCCSTDVHFDCYAQVNRPLRITNHYLYRWVSFHDSFRGELQPSASVYARVNGCQCDCMIEFVLIYLHDVSV